MRKAGLWGAWRHPGSNTLSEGERRPPSQTAAKVSRRLLPPCRGATREGRRSSSREGQAGVVPWDGEPVPAEPPPSQHPAGLLHHRDAGGLRFFQLREPFQSDLTLAPAVGTQPWSQTLPSMDYKPSSQLPRFLGKCPGRAGQSAQGRVKDRRRCHSLERPHSGAHSLSREGAGPRGRVLFLPRPPFPRLQTVEWGRTRYPVSLSLARESGSRADNSQPRGLQHRLCLDGGGL